MELIVFDVGHGFCAYLRCDNGTGVLFDCGYDDQNGFRPSTYFPAIGVHSLKALVIGNFDADHVSDLANLLRVVRVEIFARNRSISCDQLTNLKLNAGPLSRGMEAALNLHRTYTSEITTTPDFAGAELTYFRNPYPRFSDSNNLSLVTFLQYDGLGIVIPGDLEKEGWQALLKDPAFCALLAKVNIFIASHHGRDNGYCEEIFNHCSPEIVIISDKGIQHDTQLHCYSDHALGIPWDENGTATTRYVLTTRCDGHIYVVKNKGQRGRITAWGGTLPVPQQMAMVSGL